MVKKSELRTAAEIRAESMLDPEYAAEMAKSVCWHCGDYTDEEDLHPALCRMCEIAGRRVVPE